MQTTRSEQPKNFNRPWHENYPKGVPAEVDVRSFQSINEVIDQTCKKYQKLPAFSCFGQTMTFEELDVASQQFAAYLQSIPELKEGDRIALQLPNLNQFPIALFGAFRAGLVVVNTNPLYTAREMEHQFCDSGAKAIVICANFAHQLEKILSKTQIKTVITTELGDLLPAPKRWVLNGVVKYVKKMVPQYHLPSAVSFREVLAQGEKLPYSPVELNLEAMAFIQYTGGTTGTAKGAVLTHGNIVANMEQVAALLNVVLEEGKEICIAPLPLYHVFSLTVNCLCFFKFGIHNVFITNPRDIPGFVKELGKWDFTLMTGVNTLFNALLNHPDFAKLDFSHLKFCVGGAMALQKSVCDRWEKVTGSFLLEGYGLTETSPVACVNPPNENLRVGTIGLPLPSTDVEIRDADGKKVPDGEPGEICIRGPQVMQGYWQKPQETANVLSSDGWLKTGDIAEMQSGGFVKIVDRQKDMISVSGFKVYPNEVEDVLSSHPKVLEVGVIGVPDEHSGEVVKAFVVKKDPSLTEAEVIEHARQGLTNYKVPKHVEFIEALPKTAVGKVLRRELR